MSVKTKLLNIRMPHEQHEGLLAVCDEHNVTAACLLSNYIDALLEGNVEPLVKAKVKGGWQGQCERHTVLRRAPNGFRKPRNRRVPPRSLVCQKGCGTVFDTNSAVESHERTCKGSIEATKIYQKWWGKVRWHRNNIRLDKLGNRIEMRLTLEEYTNLLKEANITVFDLPDYALGRYRDIGHYEVGNCRFIPRIMNLYENHYSSLLISLGKHPYNIPLDVYLQGLDDFADHACRMPSGI